MPDLNCLNKKIEESKEKAKKILLKTKIDENSNSLAKELADLEAKIFTLEFNFKLLMPQVDSENNSVC
jgi:hypothetical protein